MSESTWNLWQRVTMKQRTRSALAVAAAVAQERVACAAVCEQRAQLQEQQAVAETSAYASERAIEARACAVAILAREGT